MIPDVRTPATTAAATTTDKLSDPNLTPLPTYPGIKGAFAATYPLLDPNPSIRLLGRATSARLEKIPPSFCVIFQNRSDLHCQEEWESIPNHDLSF